MADMISFGIYEDGMTNKLLSRDVWTNGVSYGCSVSRLFCKYSNVISLLSLLPREHKYDTLGLLPCYLDELTTLRLKCLKEKKHG